MCAGDGCGDIEKDLCCVLSEDVVTTKEMWVELFDLAVRALHRSIDHDDPAPERPGFVVYTKKAAGHHEFE